MRYDLKLFFHRFNLFSTWSTVPNQFFWAYYRDPKNIPKYLILSLPHSNSAARGTRNVFLFLQLHLKEETIGTKLCIEHWCCQSSLLGYLVHPWIIHHSNTGYSNGSTIPASWYSFCQLQKDDRLSQPHLVLIQWQAGFEPQTLGSKPTTLTIKPTPGIVCTSQKFIHTFSSHYPADISPSLIHPLNNPSLSID